jgi:ribose transport system substrate-binding protein
MDEGVLTEAKALGFNVVVDGPTNYSAELQVPILDALLSKPLSALILAPTDVKALDPTIKLYDSKHIPVFLTDSPVVDMSLVENAIYTNNYLGGELAAKEIAAFAKDSGTVGIIGSVPGSGSQIPRINGFEAGMKKFPKMTVLPIQYDESSISTAASQTAGELTSHPAMVGVFGDNDYSGEGAAQGIVASGDKGKVLDVAYDSDPAEVKYLEEGEINVLIAQDPYYEGVLSVEYVHDWLTGKHSLVPKSLETGVFAVTLKNLHAPSTQKWLYTNSVPTNNT